MWPSNRLSAYHEVASHWGQGDQLEDKFRRQGVQDRDRYEHSI